MLNQNEIICVYCKRKAELMSSNMKTVVVCRECGTAIDLETYKELFDDMVYGERVNDVWINTPPRRKT